MGTGKRIEELRIDMGLLQKELAARLNVSPATVSHYEAGIHQPDAENLVRIADLFDVSVDYLLGRNDTRLSSSILNQMFYLETGTMMTNGQLMYEILKLSGDSRKYIIQTLRLLQVNEDQSRKNRQAAVVHENEKIFK